MNNFELANGSHVWFEGVVAAKSRNQSGSLWSVVVQDLTTPTDQVQVELNAYFAANKRNNGLGFAIPLTSIIGVKAYKFLSQTL